jgi:hypothetical protein
LILNYKFNEDFQLESRISYNHFICDYSEFSQNFPSILTQVVYNNQNYDSAKINRKYLLSFSGISTDLLGRFKISFIGIGTVIGISLTDFFYNNVSEKFEITEPAGASYKVLTDEELKEKNIKIKYVNNNHGIQLNDNQLQNLKEFRFGLLTGLDYSYVYRNFSFRVLTYYNIALTGLLSDKNSRMDYFQFGASFYYSF